MILPAEISFIVSQNDKGDNPKRPDYRGEVVIGAVTYELAAWKRTKQGTTKQFVSGKLTIKPPKADPGAFRGSEEPKKEAEKPAETPKGEEDVPF